MKKIRPTLCLLAAVAILLVFALQYPLQTTFPIGGDAVRVVARAQEVLDQPTRLISNSNYPGSTAIVAASAIVPLAWPTRFVWLMVTFYVLSGLALSWLLLKHFGWREAAFGTIFWAFVPTGVTRHFEDATLAQLISLPVLLLCLEAVIAGRTWLSLLLFLIAGVLHPLSAVILGASLGLTLVSLWPRWRSLSTQLRRLLVSWSIALPLLGGVIFWWRGRAFVGVEYDHPLDLVHLSQTHMLPLLFLGLLGWLLLLRQYRENLIKVTTLISFTIAAALFSLTHVGGLSPIPHRFDSYAIAAALIGAAVALPWVVNQLFSTRLWRSVFVVISLATLGAVSWQANAFVYDFYESSGKYARIHPDELAAIDWMQNNLPADAHVVTTETNRHSEWIPVLSDLAWTGVSENREFFQVPGVTHLAFFLNREEIPTELTSWPIVYRNDGVVVLELFLAGPQ